mmetsp:Transcript_66995/g.143281  ORF Transcript_66995/g.143281 Transcript_66995/m.143281 type:complete len:236 (-) Transcript_66995:364-1071(-)
MPLENHHPILREALVLLHAKVLSRGGQTLRWIQRLTILAAASLLLGKAVCTALQDMVKLLCLHRFLVQLAEAQHRPFFQWLLLLIFLSLLRLFDLNHLPLLALENLPQVCMWEVDDTLHEKAPAFAPRCQRAGRNPGHFEMRYAPELVQQRLRLLDEGLAVLVEGIAKEAERRLREDDRQCREDPVTHLCFAGLAMHFQGEEMPTSCDVRPQGAECLTSGATEDDAKGDPKEVGA